MDICTAPDTGVGVGLNDLPDDLQHRILPFLDVIALLHLQVCSSYHHTLITRESNRLWKSLHDARWKSGKKKRGGLQSRRGRGRRRRRALGGEADGGPDVDDDDADGEHDSDGDDDGVVFFHWFREYIRRHRLDGDVMPTLRDLRRYGDAEPNLAWSWLLVEGGLDIVDRLREIVKVTGAEDDSPRFPYAFEAKDLGSMARKALVAIHRMGVFEEWRKLMLTLDDDFRRGGASSSSAAPRPGTPPSSTSPCIEDGAILLARFYQTPERLLQCDSLDQLDDEISDRLDDLASVLSARLIERRRRESVVMEPGGGDEGSSYPISIILEEMKPFFGGGDTGLNDRPGQNVVTSGPGNKPSVRLPLFGNEADYYNHRNSLLDHVLDTRAGIPITLSVIYAAIVRRATGVVMEPVNLPGHFILATPRGATDDTSRATGGRYFVDAFRGGAVLDLAQCRDLVGGFSVLWDDDMVQPVPYAEVWQRMIRNLLNCHSMQAFAGDFAEARGEEGAETLSSEEGEEGAEMRLFRKIAIPTRFLLADVLFRIPSAVDMADAPALYRKFC